MLAPVPSVGPNAMTANYGAQYNPLTFVTKVIPILVLPVVVATESRTQCHVISTP